MRRLLIIIAGLALGSSASAATFCRPVGGHLIDCYAAESAAVLEARLGVSGFLAAPDGTKHGSTYTLDGGGAIASATPPADPPAPQAKPVALSPARLIALIATVIGNDAWAAAWTDNSSAALITMRSILMVAKEIDRDDPVTQAGLAAIVGAGHMTADQKAAVLAAWQTE